MPVERDVHEMNVDSTQQKGSKENFEPERDFLAKPFRVDTIDMKQSQQGSKGSKS